MFLCEKIVDLEVEVYYVQRKLILVDENDRRVLYISYIGIEITKHRDIILSNQHDYTLTII